jgi:AraC-like DNA-binding protein
MSANPKNQFFPGNGAFTPPDPKSAALEGGMRKEAFIRKLNHILEANLSDENFGLPGLCRAAGVSRSQLFRKMKAAINEAPSDFIRMYRLRRAKELLQKTDMRVSEIAYEVGFRDPAYFSYSFHGAFGVTPSSVRM